MPLDSDVHCTVEGQLVYPAVNLFYLIFFLPLSFIMHGKHIHNLYMEHRKSN